MMMAAKGYMSNPTSYFIGTKVCRLVVLKRNQVRVPKLAFQTLDAHIITRCNYIYQSFSVLCNPFFCFDIKLLCV